MQSLEEGKKTKPERTCKFWGQWDGSGTGFWIRMKNSNAFFHSRRAEGLEEWEFVVREQNISVYDL